MISHIIPPKIIQHPTVIFGSKIWVTLIKYFLYNLAGKFHENKKWYMNQYLMNLIYRLIVTLLLHRFKIYFKGQVYYI